MNIEFRNRRYITMLIFELLSGLLILATYGSHVIPCTPPEKMVALDLPNPAIIRIVHPASGRSPNLLNNMYIIQVSKDTLLTSRFDGCRLAVNVTSVKSTNARWLDVIAYYLGCNDICTSL